MLLVLALLTGCTAIDSSPTSAPSANIANYEVVREWKMGLEVKVQRSGRSSVSQEDLEEIQRDLSKRYPMEGRSVVIYRDQRGEIARYLVEGTRWNFRGEQ